MFCEVVVVVVDDTAGVEVVVVFTDVDVDDAGTVVAITVVVDFTETEFRVRTSCGGKPDLVSVGTNDVGKVGNG